MLGKMYRCLQEDILVGGGVEKRGICWGNFPSRNLSWGEENFHEGSAGFSSIIKKKTMKK